ncbi:MAG: hypothetical protein EOP04_08680 [Proteobacteria bacterium]|nr:MAG: hypothetical protein EOP04_08680 [Pseudomonadota bacterium]
MQSKCDVNQSEMTTDWKELAIRLGSLKIDGSESGSDHLAQVALKSILGTEWITSAVDHVVANRPGSELALGCLRAVCSWEAVQYAFLIYKASTGERADRAVWLIKHIAHPKTIEWVDDFLEDQNVAHWGLGLLDQLVWCERAPDLRRIEQLLEKASGLYEGALEPQVRFIRSNLTQGNSC